tara:strand:- start:77 stop:469 length:393 start_codon:yes stop_codon:yes gene_type:complete
MSSIHEVLNCVDMRRKIFNFKSQSIKTTTKNNYDLVIKELNLCVSKVLEDSDINEESINDYVELDIALIPDQYFSAFDWLMEEINDIKEKKYNLNKVVEDSDSDNEEEHYNIGIALLTGVAFATVGKIIL